MKRREQWPKPDEYGYTEAQVRELCAKYGRTWEQFLRWLHGQTFTAAPDGSFRYYVGDVKRFMVVGPRARVMD